MRAQSQGRLPDREPVAIVDVGSNSVRLVVFEGVTRVPTLFFNEKLLAGLGRTIVSTGRLDEAGVEIALGAFARFRALADQIGAQEIHVIATAATREAENGPEFVRRAEDILRAPVKILTGKEEATYAAYAVMAHVHRAEGLVGDLGGGSLELMQLGAEGLGDGVTLPLGGLRLAETSKQDLKEARSIARQSLRGTDVLEGLEGKPFYAVGGTWRNMARLHMTTIGYPLSVLHEYELDCTSKQTLGFLETVAKGDFSDLTGIKEVSKNRRDLLPYGAAVMLELIERMKPSRIVISGVGVREGYLYGLLDEDDRNGDPLLIAARELAVLRARSVRHAEELAEWTGPAFAALGLDETEEEGRFRQAACLIADVGWRAHPDYRGLQSMNVIAHGNFTAIPHPGRAYIALANLFRHEGVHDDGAAGELSNLLDERLTKRAAALGLLMRVLYVMSAAMPGVLPRLRIKRGNGEVKLIVPAALNTLYGERPENRLAKLSKHLDLPIKLVVE